MALFGKNKKNDNTGKTEPNGSENIEKTPSAEVPLNTDPHAAALSSSAESPAAANNDVKAAHEDAHKTDAAYAANDVLAGAETPHITGAQESYAAPPSHTAPAYHTPEGFDFNRYFLAERRIALENISYETGRIGGGARQFKLGVKDTIVAQVIAQAGVKVTYNRTLRFEPEGPFTLSVSFAVMLVFNPGTRGEIDWKTIDVADEFKKNCPALVQTMAAKAALLVGEITAANGGAPIIPVR